MPAAVAARLPACSAVPHARMVPVVSGTLAGMVSGRDSWALWAHAVLHRASAARESGCDAPHYFSYMLMYAAISACVLMRSAVVNCGQR